MITASPEWIHTLEGLKSDTSYDVATVSATTNPLPSMTPTTPTTPTPPLNDPTHRPKPDASQMSALFAKLNRRRNHRSPGAFGCQNGKPIDARYPVNGNEGREERLDAIDAARAARKAFTRA